MNVLYEVLSFLAGHASVVLLGIAALILNYPEASMFVSIGGVIFIVGYSYRNWFLRKWNWHVWYRIQRTMHRIRKYLHPAGRLMTKSQYLPVVNRLDDSLAAMCEEHMLSKRQKRRILAVIGKALKAEIHVQFADLIPRKRHPRGMRAHIEKNIESAKAGPKGSIPGPPEPAPAGNIVRLSYLRGKQNAA